MRLKRAAKAKGGFYVEDEPALAFVIRIRGINDMHPKSRKILQLLRLKQIHNGVFMKVRSSAGPVPPRGGRAECGERIGSKACYEAAQTLLSTLRQNAISLRWQM